MLLRKRVQGDSFSGGSYGRLYAPTQDSLAPRLAAAGEVLDGCTPDEIYHGLEPACLVVRLVRRHGPAFGVSVALESNSTSAAWRVEDIFRLSS